MGPSRDYLTKIQRDFRLLDGLPRNVRALVHEYGAKRVVDLHNRGLGAAAIKQHFENAAIFASALK